jgi:hypothetical protein
VLLYVAHSLLHFFPLLRIRPIGLFQFIITSEIMNHRHMVGLLGRVISSSQGLYLHRTTQHRQTRKKHPCLKRDSNPRSGVQALKDRNSDRAVTGSAKLHLIRINCVLAFIVMAKVITSHSRNCVFVLAGTLRWQWQWTWLMDKPCLLYLVVPHYKQRD